MQSLGPARGVQGRACGQRQQRRSGRAHWGRFGLNYTSSSRCTAVRAVASPPEQAAVRPAAAPPAPDANQRIREGGTEAGLVLAQSSKRDPEQPSLASQLPPLAPGAALDVAVVGCGPAGLFLAAQLAERGLKVGLIGPDVPFVNNYGVWVDEFKAVGLEDTLELTFPDAQCWFGEGHEVRVGRAYGRVSRRKLRARLTSLCANAGVAYLADEVTAIETPDGPGASSRLATAGGAALGARLVALASGQAAGRFLKYEEGAPAVAAQTAYGIEAEVEGYSDAYDPKAMLFMDYRRHHTGVWEGSAQRLQRGKHPNAADGLWGSSGEVPSFLYAMPLANGRVFLEETCLVARPALPFSVLKRRLERRMAAMGLKLKTVHEEEWSYIPVGGPLPLPGQPVAAFGAAANLVHPATGFSVSRSLREAPAAAAAAAAALARPDAGAREAAAAVWEALWPAERRRQAAFHLFGMELLIQLDLGSTNDFFRTFFALPQTYWRGFLGSSLSSGQLVVFALLTFALAPAGIKGKLVSHLITDPSGAYLAQKYLGGSSEGSSSSGGGADGGGSSDGPRVAAAAGLLLALSQIAAARGGDA
ncbi:chloroplast lycopene epsilon-cyclase precursor [Raphidocelis subcapitata]|uniref:Chloroplast lycopene epsilon-cyclase n=1 Tax=Raphidocelis subcapitata TaxID=307507 RepID=A0A2V0P175_9CHLO|nr:chloroplast lycopene epsilon-cyclase precursor [Raphidocelis subcapitata]|eukprot:GBF93614.1 chloroplast lycopene epsilon-cyclase precursor [Raphidocelis subcapitata]